VDYHYFQRGDDIVINPDSCFTLLVYRWESLHIPFVKMFGTHRSSTRKMTRDIWAYQVEPPAFSGAGKFKAWTAGSADRQHSAAAWRVERTDRCEPAVEQSRRSEGESTAPRANLGAAARAIETIPSDSTLWLCTRDEYVSNAINSDIAEWSANGWRNRAGEAVKNVDILERIRSTIRDRRLTVTAEFIGSEGSTDRKELDRLQGLANTTRKGEA
jgi:ribonuclease HI